jgi:hypothetical protein
MGLTPVASFSVLFDDGENIDIGSPMVNVAGYDFYPTSCVFSILES